MDLHKLTRELHAKNDTKIVMYVARTVSAAYRNDRAA